MSASATPSHAASENTAVLTYKGDTFRTGQYSNETFLTTANVNVSSFGKHVSYPVDGRVYAQPLYVPNVTIGGSLHNVTFVATEHDSIYAFDADSRVAIAPLWQRSFINVAHGVTPIPISDVKCNDLTPEIGITGTPVIDGNSGTLYVVVATKERGHYFQRLHALDITTGQERPSSPTVITGIEKGSGDGNVNGYVRFDPLSGNQRPALLLFNQVIYIAWASHCDHNPYHGWVMGYNASTLQKVPGATYSDTRNGSQGGIWQSGGGLATDGQGNLYFTTGNGTFDLFSGGKDAGNTILKMSTQNGLRRLDYFTPFNQSCLNVSDTDLGSGGILLLPTINEAIQGGKEGRLYVVSESSMGHYTSIHNTCSNQQRTDVDHVLQEFPPQTASGGLYNTPAFWNGSNGDYVYIVGAQDSLKAYQVTNGLLSVSPTSQTPETFTFPGGNPVVSSNGTTPGTGVLWTIDPTQVLRAYDATNLSSELYTSNQNAARDALPSYVTFSTPVIANGEVFVGTQSTLEIYGLLS